MENAIRRSKRYRSNIDYARLHSGVTYNSDDSGSDDEVTFQPFESNLTVASDTPLPVSDDSFSDTEIPPNQEVVSSIKCSKVLASSVLVREEAVAQEDSHEDLHDSSEGIPTSQLIQDEVPTKEDFKDLCNFICGKVDILEGKFSILESENFMLRARLIKIQAQIKKLINCNSHSSDNNK